MPAHFDPSIRLLRNHSGQGMYREMEHERAFQFKRCTMEFELLQKKLANVAQLVQQLKAENEQFRKEIAQQAGIVDTRKIAMLAAVQCASRRRVAERTLLNSLDEIIGSSSP